MKKILIFIFIVCAICGQTNAQNNIKRDIVLIGQSELSPGDHIGIYDGFWRSSSERTKNMLDEPINFRIGSKESNFCIWLYHYTFSDRKQNLAIVDLPISSLDAYDVDVIYIDEFFVDKAKEDVWRWALDCSRNATMWILDRSLYYKSSEKLTEPDMMKLIQVKIQTGIIPEAFRIEYAHELECPQRTNNN